MILLYTYIWVNWILLRRDTLKPAIASAIENADRIGISVMPCLK